MTMIYEDVYSYLGHFGVKGQRWGVRNERKTSSEEKPKMSTKKKAAIILGSAAVATALVAGGLYAKKHFNTPISEVSSSSSGQNLAKSLAKEPVSIVHSSRGKNRGFHFLQRGGLEDPLTEYSKAGLTGDSPSPGYFKRYGDRSEKVFSVFNDPEGRKDRAGRIIPHEVFLPENLAKGVNNSGDAERVSWPLIKDTFAAMYRASEQD